MLGNLVVHAVNHYSLTQQGGGGVMGEVSKSGVERKTLPSVASTNQCRGQTAG